MPNSNLPRNSPADIDAASIAFAVEALRRGGVVAYPTEAVFGFGCDPGNKSALRRLLTIKQRAFDQGVLLIGSAFKQVAPYIAADCPDDALDRARASWPGPHTWVFPRSEQAPDWIVGSHAGIALRVTAHPVAAALCQAFGTALVSTSVNRHGSEPARTGDAVEHEFGLLLDAIVAGKVGDAANPTSIRDAISGEWLRR
ncbi:MAG: Sua5/YciO/YrdC/YwlC family protein [Dokdonella sp.]